VLVIQTESLQDCATAVRSVLAEFRDRSLQDMIPGGNNASPENLAAYIHERLLGYSVQAIDVWLDDIGVRLEW
jgi:hypothetical protein